MAMRTGLSKAGAILAAALIMTSVSALPAEAARSKAPSCVAKAQKDNKLSARDVKNLRVGKQLTVNGRQVTVQKGDTLSSLCRKTKA